MSIRSAQNQAPPSIDERDIRALTEYLTVLENIGRAKDAPGLYLVVSGSNGDEYLVDATSSVCECADYQYREPAGGCKHVRRVAFETGDRAVPAEYADMVPADFGKHVDTEPTFVATDGGQHRRSWRANRTGGAA